MGNKYYIVERKFKPKEVAFIKVSDGKLEHIDGMKSITNNMRVKKGNLTTKIYATSNYKIFLTDEDSFNLQMNSYLNKLIKNK